MTTQLVRRIGDSYGVRTIGDLLVGFKWIAGAIDEFGPELFIYGTEESHGYMAGSYVRDKDGAAASMLLCELAAKLKAAGQTLHEKLDALFWQHGVHAERTISVQMPGSEGMARMMEVMAAFRAAPPTEIAGDRVAQIRDYERQTVTPAGGRACACSKARRATSCFSIWRPRAITSPAAPAAPSRRSSSTCSPTRRRNSSRISKTPNASLKSGCCAWKPTCANSRACKVFSSDTLPIFATIFALSKLLNQSFMNYSLVIHRRFILL